MENEMRRIGSIRASAKLGVMACAIVVMGFLLVPERSERNGAPPTPLVAEGVVGKTSPIAAYDRDAIQIAVSAFVWEAAKSEPGMSRSLLKV